MTSPTPYAASAESLYRRASYVVAVATIAGFFASSAAVAGAIPAPADIGKLPVADRLKLAPETTVTFLGRTVTIATLLQEHKNRLGRLATARSLAAGEVFKPAGILTGDRKLSFTGRVTLPTTVPLSIAPRPTPTATRSALASAALHAIPTQSLQTGTPVIANFAGHGYSIDYVAYCTALKATVCIYIPGGYRYINESVSTSVSTPGTPLFVDLDPLMSPAECGANGGVENEESSYQGTQMECEFRYPALSTDSFYGGTTLSSRISTTTCGDAFTVTLDPHGSVAVSYPFTTTGTDSHGFAAEDVATTIACSISVVAPTQ